MSAKSSLYDSYRLSNSTTIPLYQGSAGPEAVQVASHLQGIYDTASQGAADIGSAAENIETVALPQDKMLARELHDNVNNRISEFSKAGDWENHLADVRSMARNYSARSQELSVPAQAYAAWQKELDDKDKNLTPYQKDSLKALALSSYTGLKKDAFGKYVGQFNGSEIAKNIDVNEKVDKWMKDIAIQKGGSEIANVNGMWKIKKGNTWETLAPGTIENTLKYAMDNDREFQAYLQQEGDIIGYHSQRIKPNNLSPVAQNKIKELVTKGYTPQQALEMMGNEDMQTRIINSARGYALNKYTYNKRTTTEDISENSNFWESQKAMERAEEKRAQNGIFGDVVTGGGIDINKFGSADDIENTRTTSVKELEIATNEVNATKNLIAKEYNTTPDKLNKQQIDNYFNKPDNKTGLGKYLSNLQNIASKQSSIDEIDQLKEEAMNLAVKKKNPGIGYKELQQSTTMDFKKNLSEFGQAGPTGKMAPLTKINQNNVDNFEVIDGDAASPLKNGYVKLKNKKTGEIVTVYPKTKKGEAIGSKFDGINWKDSWSDAATNIRSNSMWMPLLDKSTPDGQTTKAGAYSSRVKSVLSAGSGGLDIKNADFGNMESDDIKDMRARIGSGNFDVKGIGKIKSDGKMYVQLSVDTDGKEPDPAIRYKTVVVGVESNVANKLSGYAIEAGMRDKDIRTYQFGRAMATNSGYEQILNMGTTGRLQVNESKLLGGKTKFEIIPQITGSLSDAISYKVSTLDNNGNTTGEPLMFSDAFDLGAFLDSHKDEGKTIQKKTK